MSAVAAPAPLWPTDPCGISRADPAMVQGRWLVEDGRIPGLDLERLRAAHSAAAHALQS